MFFRLILVSLVAFGPLILNAQCSICTKTAQQLGDESASGLNTGIMYLAFIPLAIFAIIGYRWWRNEKMHRGN